MSLFKSMLPVAGLAFIAGLPLTAAAQEGSGNAGVSGEGDFRLYCAACHGEDGKGEGPKSFGLSVKTPDLTKLKQKYGGTFPAEKLLKVIDGRDALAAHVEREMPVWGQWFKLEAGQELGGAEGDEGTVKRRIDNLLGFIESIQD